MHTNWLTGRTALVTGASRGIGAAIATSLASAGARVCLTGRSEVALLEVATSIRAEGGEVVFACSHDLAQRDGVDALVDDVAALAVHVDILVNNAGIVRDARLVKMTLEEWDRVMAVNLKGVFLCGQAAARIMTEQGSGVILNATSVVGLYGNFGQSNYVATKAGVIGMTKTWARELGRKGVRVNAVAPGFIGTEIIKDMPQKVIDMMAEKAPLGRIGQPEDIASAYLYLASDQASFVTGAVLSVDGGLVI